MPTPPEAPKINLTPQEETIRKFLVDAAAEIDSSSKNTDDEEPLTLRFTGGWVRDKLLGESCHDIDVGINKMTGFEFATRFNEFLTDRHAEYNILPHRIHKIRINPDKSKHLETATTKILNIDIDFVNLRTEVYSKGSRIPQMKFGTPVQDALRRDACVNALFYNIHTQKVEDFTGKGLQDLKNKFLRTPLAPFETFRDDPLRILRLIRFSSRLSFVIDPEAEEAMKNPEIKKALRMKIARERVGIEVDKMLKGPYPYIALLQIRSLGLFDCIFAPPLEEIPSLPVDHLSIATLILKQLISGNETSYSNLNSLMETQHDWYMGWMIASLTPWKGYFFSEAERVDNIPAATAAFREGLRLSVKLSLTIFESYRNYNKINDFVQTHASNDKIARSEVGNFIRNLGADWRNQYLCALLLETIPSWKEGDHSPSPEAEEIMKKYSTFLARIKELGLTEAHSIKNILDGRKLMAALGQTKSGPWIMDAFNQLMTWQLDNPDQDKESAEVWVKENKGNLLGKLPC